MNLLIACLIGPVMMVAIEMTVGFWPSAAYASFVSVACLVAVMRAEDEK